MELNPKIPIVIMIILILLFLSGIPFALVKSVFVKPVINQTENKTNTIIIYQNITITVTPTPDGKQYFAGEYQTGIRKLGRWFSWFRDNVTGYSDMSGHVKVYDYRMFDSVHIFDPADYRYYEVVPHEPDKKYLFIFVKIYLDDVIGDNTDLWLPNEEHFYIQANGTLTTPIQWEKRLRIREIENTAVDDGSTNIEYYGVYNTYSKDKKYAPSAGEIAVPLYNVLAGESNAIDGYIVYYIDKSVKEEDIIVLTDLYAFGNPAWILKS